MNTTNENGWECQTHSCFCEGCSECRQIMKKNLAEARKNRQHESHETNVECEKIVSNLDNNQYSRYENGEELSDIRNGGAI